MSEKLQKPMRVLAYTSLSLVLLSGCGSPAVGSGYHPQQGKRVANYDHPVAIAHPVDGGSVETPFVLFGDATAYKGIISFEITSAENEIVAEGETLAGSMGKFSKFAVELDLDPGSYTVTVSQTNPPERAVTTPPFSSSVDFTVSGQRAG